jgi:hypothetical protein
VHAAAIVLENLGMAPAAGLRDPRSRLVRGTHVVRAVAVGAHRGLDLTGRGNLGVHAVQRPVIVGRMAGPAGQVQAAGQVSSGGVVDLRVRISAQSCVAGIATDAELLMQGLLERFRRDEERQALAAGEGELQRGIPVAGQASLGIVLLRHGHLCAG